MTGMLTGCGSDTTKITEGMQLVETLDYQGALNAFDEAEAQKEDSRLIARGRGIASMGLTEYDQAVEYNHSREREVCFLATHGLLHLLGYDHMTIEEEKVMFGKQEELLNEFEIKR